MRSIAKTVLYRSPAAVRLFVRRALYAYRLKAGTFVSPEPEFSMLDEFVSDGDWVIDIGANVGHYTVRLSALVGDAGRVVSFEPWPESFALLVANCMRSRSHNVTLLNLAVSDHGRSSGMDVPVGEDGLPDGYLARLSPSVRSQGVLCCAVDSLEIPHKVSLVKIDVEGHEEKAIGGMVVLLQRDRPVLIVENPTATTKSRLAGLGYRASRNPGSPNTIFRAPPA